MKRVFRVAIIVAGGLFLSSLFFSSPTNAQVKHPDEGSARADCGSDAYETSGSGDWYCPTRSSSSNRGLFGKINPPAGVNPSVSGIGNMIGAILRILVIVAGVWALFNFIIAGYQFIQAGGDSKAVAGAWARIWQSLIGIVIVAASFLFAAIIGQLFFGDPGAILSPTLVP